MNNKNELHEDSVLEGKRVLVVGAGGFAGGFIVAEGLRRGCEVWAGVRASTSREYLSDPRIKFLTLDFENPSMLPAALQDALPEGEKWDYIIYNLGATKCLNFMQFSKINYGCLRDFCNALIENSMVPGKLVFISSLSAIGPGDEKTYRPFTEKMPLLPNTRYGASKLKAEMLLASSGIPYVILRATGLYGPRDKDYFLEFQSLAKGFDFQVGFKKQILTFLYVEDLARAAYDALMRAPAGQTYNIAEGRSYTQKEFRHMTLKALGKRHVLTMKLPLAAVRLVSVIAEKWGVARMKPSTLNRDKYNILKQRNWGVDISKAREGFGFDPKVSLSEGIDLSIRWYREKGWL